jgi:hypothetical protein
MIMLLHVSRTAHSHPQQFALAVLVSAAVVAATWMLQRRRS